MKDKKLEELAKQYLQEKFTCRIITREIEAKASQLDAVESKLRKIETSLKERCGSNIPERFIVIDGDVIIVTSERVRLASEVLEID